MNIFYLDSDIKRNAQYHCDKHVVKMLLEQTQILCSAYYYTGDIPELSYKLAHKNHPCCVWARESLSNWKWLKEMTLALYDEYKHRYNKTHKSGELLKHLPQPQLQDIGITKRPQAMPMQYRELDPIVAYRNYYKFEKKEFLTYKNRPVPEWLY